MKHTPGPWNATVYSGTFDQPLITSNEGVIARLHSFPERQHEINAKLIAAAPELLEILQKLIENYEDDKNDPNKTYDAFWEAKELIQKLEK